MTVDQNGNASKALNGETITNAAPASDDGADDPKAERRSQRQGPAYAGLNQRHRKTLHIEGPFVPMPTALLEHSIWITLSRPARIVIDFLCVQRSNKRGLNNGALKATFSQLRERGLHRNQCAAAFREIEAYGLVSCTERGGYSAGRGVASTYRLTFFPSVDSKGRVHRATNDWQRKTVEEIRDFQLDEKHRRAQQRGGRKIAKAGPSAAKWLLKREAGHLRLVPPQGEPDREGSE